MPRAGHPTPTTPRLVSDREEVRGFLDADPVSNAFVWDRVFQQPEYDVYADGPPPRGVMAVHRTHRPGGANFIALAADDPSSAGPLMAYLPKGFTIVHLTEEFPLALLEPRAAEFHPRPAWLFELSREDFVDRPDDRVRPIGPEFAGLIAKTWEPDWPAEGYVRRRIAVGPTASIYDRGEPIAWALTHTVTDRVGVIGMVHVQEGHRRKGLARSVVSAVVRDLQKLGRHPALHVYWDNAASLALFPSLGFRRVKRQIWGDAVFR